MLLMISGTNLIGKGDSNFVRQRKRERFLYLLALALLKLITCQLQGKKLSHQIVKNGSENYERKIKR